MNKNWTTQWHKRPSTIVDLYASTPYTFYDKFLITFKPLEYNDCIELWMEKKQNYELSSNLLFHRNLIS